MDINRSIIIFLAICLLFFVIAFFGNIEWKNGEKYEGFQNDEQALPEDFNDCQKHGYNHAELGENNKVYCTLKDLDNIKNASTQKCILAIRGEGTPLPGEYYCDDQTEKRKAIQRLYRENTANNDEVYGSCQQGEVDFSLSTPIMKFCNIGNRKCYKPPVDGVEDDVVSRYLQDKGENISACPDCPPFMRDGGNMKEHRNIFVCDRIDLRNNGKLKDIKVERNSGLTEIFGNISSITASVAYNLNSLDPVNIGKYRTRTVSFRPWNTDIPIRVTAIHTQANELYNFNPKRKYTSYVLPFTIRYANRENTYTVFLNPYNMRFMNIRNHKNVPEDEQANYDEIYSEEQKLARILNEHMNINRHIREFSYGLMRDDDFKQAIRKMGVTKVSFQIPVRVKRGFSMFRRRSRRYKTVYVTRHKIVRIQDLESEEKKNKAVDDYIYKYEKMLNRNGNKIITKAKQLYKRARNETHDSILQKIKRMYLAMILRR